MFKRSKKITGLNGSRLLALAAQQSSADTETLTRIAWVFLLSRTLQDLARTKSALSLVQVKVDKFIFISAKF